MENKFKTLREWTNSHCGFLWALAEDVSEENLDERYSSGEVFEKALEYDGICGYASSLKNLYEECFGETVIKADFGTMRSLCIRNDWFSAGTNEQYDKMFKMAEDGCRISELALVIWICSVDTTVEEIEKTLRKELIKHDDEE